MALSAFGRIGSIMYLSRPIGSIYAASMVDLPFRLDRSSPSPAYRQLEEYLRGLIATGRMAAGTKLPATRELATSLGAARVTVVQAYARLLADGLVRSHVGQGTFVEVALAAGAQTSPAGGGRSFVWSSLFALRARQ